MKTKSVDFYLSQLDFNLRSYRSTYDRVFSRKLTIPKHCAGYFLAVLARTSSLYGDYLFLREVEATIPIQSTVDNQTRGSGHAVVESKLRERFEKRLLSLPCWLLFHPRNYFVTENRLRTHADYIAALVLHLPEIYSETIASGRFVRQAREEGGFSESCLARLLSGLEHAAHHSSYCRHALEILSYEGSWYPRNS